MEPPLCLPMELLGKLLNSQVNHKPQEDIKASASRGTAGGTDRLGTRRLTASGRGMEIQGIPMSKLEEAEGMEAVVDVICFRHRDDGSTGGGSLAFMFIGCIEVVNSQSSI